MNISLFFKGIFIRFKYKKLFRLIKDTEFLATLSFNGLGFLRSLFVGNIESFYSCEKIDAKYINDDVDNILDAYNAYLRRSGDFVSKISQIFRIILNKSDNRG